MTVGWIVVSFFTLIVALGMAEIVSAIPTSGGEFVAVDNTSRAVS